MAKKWLIILIVVLVLLVGGIMCRRIEVQEQSNWTKRSENLLKIKKHPKKPLKKKNLFAE
jgi:hypothetical protein